MNKKNMGRLLNPNEIENYEHKSKILYENGWTDLWHKDNWVRTEWLEHPTIDIDRAGCSTNVAYSTYIKETSK